ncbi:MAG: DinB family protein [Bacteroidota bacterium]
MKKLFIPFVLLAFTGFKAPVSPLTEQERKAAIAQLTDTREFLQESIKGLSTAQLNFKSSPESWSVAECVEHIAISENMIFGMAEGGLKAPADPSKRAEVKMSDEQIFGMITDRSGKVKTSEAFVPTGKFGSYEGSVKEFLAKRDSHIDYIKTTQDDLRNHYATLPFGLIDTYQVVVFMAGHTKRHTLQIEEVKANANFPKK